jgi:carbamoylphosphate synthase small subunit
VPGIYGIDTRALTKKLRSSGALLGKLVFDEDADDVIAFEDPNTRNLVAEVSVPAPVVYNDNGKGLEWI